MKYAHPLLACIATAALAAEGPTKAQCDAGWKANYSTDDAS